MGEEPYLGPERYRYLYPAGSLYKANATLIGGSDWDVSTYNPFRAFRLRSRALADPGKSLSISMSASRLRQQSTPIRSMPPTP